MPRPEETAETAAPTDRPQAPQSTTSSRSIKISARLEDLGDRWEVQLPGREPFLLGKQSWRIELETFSKLPPPHGLTAEEVAAILEAIESSRAEATPAEGVTTIPLIELPEGLLEERRTRVITTRVASELARQLVDLYKVKVPVVNNTPIGIFCYNGGAYEECEEKLLHVLEYHYRTYGLEERGVSYRSLRAEFLAHVEDSAKVFRGFDHHLLLFRNGVFDWDRLERGENPRLELSPDLLILHRLDHEIDWSVFEDGSCYSNLEACMEARTPFFRKVFQDWVGDKWVLLYEIIGYTLYSKGYPFSKAIMLEGEGSNGKSTYLALLKAILGASNITSITLQEIASDKFAGAELYGKLANIYADLPSEMLRQTGRFKILTGEDYVCFDRKYAKRRVCFTNYAKLVFSCNELPAVTDTTLAFWRRWIVVKFPNQFPDNPKFKDEVVKHPEIPSLIALSILAFRRVLERGRFSYQEEATDYREVWMRKVDPVYDFIRYMEQNGLLARDKNGRVEDKDLYMLYTKYHNIFREDEVLPKKTFTERLESYGIVKKRVGSRRYYAGISLLKPLNEVVAILEEREGEAPE